MIEGWKIIRKRLTVEEPMEPNLYLGCSKEFQDCIVDKEPSNVQGLATPELEKAHIRYPEHVCFFLPVGQVPLCAAISNLQLTDTGNWLRRLRDIQPD